MSKRSGIVPILLIAILVLSGCGQSVSKPEDFTIEDGVLTGYSGKASKIEIPEGVTAHLRLPSGYTETLGGGSYRFAE